MSAIVDSVWFQSGADVIGIVLTKSDDGYKAYIGSAIGRNREHDERLVAMRGSSFPYGKRIWPQYKAWRE